jgi:ACT domain-containing protein
LKSLIDMETTAPALRLIIKDQQGMYSQQLDSVMRNENLKTIHSDCSG